MTHLKKPHFRDNLDSWGPWAAARFQTEGARNGFLFAIADAHDTGWGAKALANDGCGAQVRWLPGRFLRLNDVAYAHGGRIVVERVPHRVMYAPSVLPRRSTASR